MSEALSRPHGDRLQFVLGTEAGMITSIVRKVGKEGSLLFKRLHVTCSMSLEEEKCGVGLRWG